MAIRRYQMGSMVTWKGWKQRTDTLCMERNIHTLGSHVSRVNALDAVLYRTIAKEVA